MPSVSVSLNQVASSSASASAYDCALLAAYQRAPYGPCNAADDCPFGSTMMVPPSSLGQAVADKGSEQ
jgi:hypothetical protein